MQRPFADSQKADDLKHYVDWAANLKYGVIDVNVPKHLTSTEVRSENIWNIMRVSLTSILGQRRLQGRSRS